MTHRMPYALAILLAGTAFLNPWRPAAEGLASANVQAARDVAQEPPPSPQPEPPAPEPEPSPGQQPEPAPSPEAEPSPAPAPPVQKTAGSAQAAAAREGSSAVRFFALGDTGTGGPGQYQVAKAIHNKCQASGCDFGVLLGDNFYPDGVESPTDMQWKLKFEDPYADLLAAGIPFYPVLGNHDYKEGQDLARGSYQVAYGQINPNWRMPDEQYSFAQGDVQFLALNTQLIIDNQRDAEGVQGNVFAAALSANKKAWVIALGHHPYLSNGTNGNAGRRLSRFLEERICPKADVYLAGHDHNLQVLKSPRTCQSLLVVSGGGGYETYPLPGGNPAHFQGQSLGFVYVVVESKKLTLEVVDAEGTVLFTHELKK